MIIATALADSRLSSTLPALLTGRNNGPSTIPDASSQASNAAAGQIGPPTRGMATLRPLPSWSVLLLGSVRTMPCSVRSIRLQLTALSSDLRNAPAKPTSRRARSRMSRVELPRAETMADKCSTLRGATRCWGRPWQRRTPRRVSRASSDLVGSGKPRSACARRMATKRPASVATENALACAARYSATISGREGDGATPGQKMPQVAIVCPTRVCGSGSLDEAKYIRVSADVCTGFRLTIVLPSADVCTRGRPAGADLALISECYRR